MPGLPVVGIGVVCAVPLLVVGIMVAGSPEPHSQLVPAGVPGEYQEDVRKAGSICPEITPSMIAAQIHAESGWNPRAVSSVGAQGIAQFMPSTWNVYGKDGDGDGIADPLNGHDGIAAQGAYMCALIGELKARPYAQGVDLMDLALAAYNAGLGNVDLYQAIPPFSETQAYVKRIRELASGIYATTQAPAVVSQAGWSYPFSQPYPITSPFGWRTDPISGQGAFHTGTDYGAPCNTQILAIKDGTVSEVSTDQFGALYVRIDHGTIGGHHIQSGYWHLSTQTVRVGQTLTGGTLIGAVGTTGYSTGCHLHLEISIDGTLHAATELIPNP